MGFEPGPNWWRVGFFFRLAAGGGKWGAAGGEPAVRFVLERADGRARKLVAAAGGASRRRSGTSARKEREKITVTRFSRASAKWHPSFSSLWDTTLDPTPSAHVENG